MGCSQGFTSVGVNIETGGEFAFAGHNPKIRRPPREEFGPGSASCDVATSVNIVVNSNLLILLLLGRVQGSMSPAAGAVAEAWALSNLERWFSGANSRGSSIFNPVTRAFLPVQRTLSSAFVDCDIVCLKFMAVALHNLVDKLSRRNGRKERREPDITAGLTGKLHAE